MRRYIALLLVGQLVMAALLTGCDTPTAGGVATIVTQISTATPGAGGTSQGTSEAGSYCTDKGGKVVKRYPAYGTNGSDPLRLSGSLQFCQFTAADQSMIAISLDTLYTEQPTLATLAYFQKPPVEATTGGANPASVYCSKLGGSDQFGGPGDAGGAWITDDKSDPFWALQACVFPDLSVLDAWGLTYRANGTIRGTDLSKVIRYRAPDTSKPGLFGK